MLLSWIFTTNFLYRDVSDRTNFPSKTNVCQRGTPRLVGFPMERQAKAPDALHSTESSPCCVTHLSTLLARLFTPTLASAVSQGRRLFVIQPKKQSPQAMWVVGDLTARGDLASDITILVWEDMYLAMRR